VLKEKKWEAGKFINIVERRKMRNRKAYIVGRRNSLHSSISDRRAEERYIINTEKYEI